MKKVLALVLTLVMMAALTVTVFAAGAFVSSPSGNQAPGLVEFENEDKDCTATIVVTSFANRGSLSEAARALLEKAYNQILGATDLSSLNADLAKLAKKLGITTADLAVSDLFDISATEDVDHDEHGAFDITLKADTLKNFVALLHYNGTEWEIVEGAKVKDGNHLVFEIDDFSPFAIVTSTVDFPEKSFPWWILIVIVAAGGLGGGTYYAWKKKLLFFH